MAATLVLYGPRSRKDAHDWIDRAPDNARVTIAGPKRSVDQNAKLHAMLTEVAMQAEWGGKRRSVEDWKDIFTAALRSEQKGLDVVPGINGGFVLLGLHTSSLSVAEFGDLITLVEMFGARHGVQFHDGEQVAA